MSDSADGEDAYLARRKKSKHACEPCRLRKRRCDGHQPCYMCTRYEYDCIYSSSRRNRRVYAKLVEPDRSNQLSTVENRRELGDLEATRAPQLPPLQGPSISATSHIESHSDALVAVQGASSFPFPRVVHDSLNQAGREPLHGIKNYTWNLGLRSEIQTRHRSIAEIIDKQEIRRLSGIYFKTVHPIYSFIDRNTFEEHIEEVCSRPNKFSHDAILAGVAALGSLFAGPNACRAETDIVQHAKDTLENVSLMHVVSLDHAEAWILRTLYLRMSAGPQASWAASCMIINLLEATRLRLHRGKGRSSHSRNPHVTENNLQDASERVTRLFWIARLLNAWISGEYGQVRVITAPVSDPLPSPRSSHDLTPFLLSIFTLSQRWTNPVPSSSESHLTAVLRDLSSLQLPNQDVLLIHQGNNALCIYRRLRTVTTQLPSETLSMVMHLGGVGTEAAERLAAVQQPWWHVANVPFQFVCVLLAMDVRESLRRVPDAMRILRFVAARFDTLKMRNAVTAAETLVQMSWKNKTEDRDILCGALGAENVTGTVIDHLPNGTVTPMAQNDGTDNGVATETIFDGIVFENFDWEQFLGPEFLMS